MGTYKIDRTGPELDATLEEVDAFGTRIGELERTSRDLIVQNDSPAVKLEVESGGSAGVFQIYDMEAPVHMVSGIQWLKNTQETDWVLADKDTGVVRAMLQMKPDGTFHIGSGMVQNQIATEVDTQALHDDIMIVAKVAIQKANKTALPTIFSGSVVPDNGLGKDLDWYHHFEAGSAIIQELYASDCREDYHPNYTTLSATYQGDVPQNGIAIVELAPATNTLFIDLETNDTLPIEELTLEITNHGQVPVAIPIEVVANSAGSFTGSYATSFDSVVQGILGVDEGSAHPSTFKITVKEGVQTDKEYDYQKHNNEWKRTDFLNVDEVHELIRSYDVTVSTTTTANKPSIAECVSAFKTLPNMDWAKDDRFYIDSTNKNKLNLVKYVANGDVDEAGTNYRFWLEALTEAV